MKKVLLTGISGFIGQHCAAELLKQGYAVRGSLRSLSKSEAITNTIKKEVDPKGNLEFCELNLLKDEGWDEAMDGVDFLMHVASPFVSKVPKDENELIKPAVEGTQRAMKAAKKAGIKRVVLTSSMVAMLGDVVGDKNINENSWTNPKAKNATAYLKSKVLAEKSAWDFIKDQGGSDPMELVTIHPGPVYGPPLSNNLSGESMTTFSEMLLGKIPMVPQAGINMSDVRDVARIHVQALENAQAAGHRFIVASEKAHTFQDLAQTLKTGGYEKVKTGLAPNFFIRLMANFSSDMKGMLPYVGKIYEGDISNTMKTFDWKPITLKKMALDTAVSVERILEGK
ncbi:aldehyde reductase [bacterium SCSIO 12741]|nr:aldehyde reductase [bacterium SCSIO 12741]